VLRVFVVNSTPLLIDTVLYVDLHNPLTEKLLRNYENKCGRFCLSAEKFTPMKHIIIVLLIALSAGACSPEKRAVTEGRVVYSIEYPDRKDNFFLYSILPKEMELNFKDGKMESRIHKANLRNVLLVDCNKKQVGAYFSYGADQWNVTLTPTDVTNMIAEQKKYTIRFLPDRDTMAGFNVKKALATAVEDPKDKITLWYTNEIMLKNPNWYNPFKEVPGVLLAYSIDRFGTRMVFKAVRFEEVEIKDEQLKMREKGASIRYRDYNQKLGDLFQTFE
jgi:hypothetical protein